MAERGKLLRDLQPGDMILIADPNARAAVVRGESVRQITHDDKDRPIGEHEGWMLIFEFRTGPREGQRDYVIGDPASRVAIA